MKEEAKIKKLFSQNLSNQEIADKLGVSLSVVKRKLASLGLRRTPEQANALKSRFVKNAYKTGKLQSLKGDDNPSKRPEVRKKISDGLRNSKTYKDSREKAKQTMLDRYGVENPMDSPELRAKLKQTLLDRYGVENSMQIPSVKEKVFAKMSKTKRQKYGWGKRVPILEEYVSKNGKISPRDLMNLWGLTEGNTYLFIRKNNLEDYVQFASSELERSMGDFLTEHGIKYYMHDKKQIAPKELDFFIPEYNLAIETNDIWTHNSTYNTFGGEPKSKRYHYDKSRACEEKGIRLIHIWDYEWFDKRQKPILESMILGACNQAETIYARKCSIEVKPSNEMKDFFNQNNIAGFRGGKFAVCLVHEGEVVMSYLMGYPYLGRGKQELEVIRGATKLNTRVIGGASKLWKFIIKEYNPKSIVYYVDYNYFNGNSLPYLGLEYISSQAGFKNFFVKERVIRNRQPSKNKEIKEMIKRGEVWEVWTAGVKKYVWENPDTL